MYPLPEGMFAPRNQWYVAAWSGEVGREPLGRWILNEPVVFYRTRAGEAVALDGRCPHRHFPLAKGCVVDDDLECGYHGITFDARGRCVRIPTEPRAPAVYDIRSYPVVERWQWVWIWPGDPELADPALIPDHDALGLTSADVDMVGDIYYAVPGRYMLMHDNLLDLSHLAYLHKSTIASDGLAEAKESRDEGPGWISSRRSMRNVVCPQYFAQIFGHDGPVDRAFGMTTWFPCLHAGFDEFRRVADADGGQGEELGTLSVYHAVTPGRLHDAHYFFAFGRNFARGDDALGAAMADGIRVTLEEDMSATREIEAMLGDLGEVPAELLLRSDAHCVQGRRRFAELIEAERDGAPAAQSASGG